MYQRLIRNWLIVLAAILQATFAVLNLFMRDPDATVLRRFVTENPSVLQAQLALAAGLCTVGAGVWLYRKAKSWLLILNGVALSLYGLIPALWSDRPLSFRPLFALLLVVMAAAIGILVLSDARTVRGLHEWLLGLAGTAVIGFALAFLALDLRWIAVDQPGSFFLLLGSFFASSAICLMALGALANGEQTGLRPAGGGAVIIG
jgi:hypothetical protein